MATYEGMRSTIADLLNRSDLTTTIQTAIQRAIKYYERKPFYFNESSTAASLATSSSQSSYNLPDDFVEDIALIMTNNGHRYQLRKQPHQWIEAIDASDTYGLPSYYSIFNEQIHYYPIPNQSHTVSLSYIKRPATLSASADSNAWTTQAEDLIEARAMWWVASRKMRNLNLAGAYKQDEKESLTALQNESEKRASSNQVTAYGL
jgi:hypothetical protein